MCRLAGAAWSCAFASTPGPALSSVDPGVAESCGLILDLLAGPQENLHGHVPVPFRLVER